MKDSHLSLHRTCIMSKLTISNTTQNPNQFSTQHDYRDKTKNDMTHLNQPEYEMVHLSNFCCSKLEYSFFIKNLESAGTTRNQFRIRIQRKSPYILINSGINVL